MEEALCQWFLSPEKGINKLLPAKSVSTKKNDFSAVLMENPKLYLGSIGKNHKRLFVEFSSAKKDKNKPEVYHIEGSTKVGKNLRKFRGTISITKLMEADPRMNDDSEKAQGVLIGDFSFDEYEKLPATGVFTGQMGITWLIDKKGKLRYNDSYDEADVIINAVYLGKWTSKQTGKSQTSRWSRYLVPCSGDLDIGDGEFIPNPKYYKYGWKGYKAGSYN